MWRSTITYLPAQLLAPALQFLSVILWAHLVPAEVLGVVTLVIATQEILFAACLTWWSHYLLRHARAFSSAQARAQLLRLEVLVVPACLVLQACVGYAILDAGRLGSRAGSWLVVLAFMLTRSLASYFGERGRSEGKAGLYTCTQVAGPALGLVGSWALIAWRGASAEAVFLGLGFGQLVACACGLLMSDFGRRAPRCDVPLFTRALAFGVPVMGGAMLALVATNVPRFMVASTQGLAAAGTFAVGYSLGLRAANFAVMLVTAGAYPLVVRTFIEEGRASGYAQLRRNILLVAIVVCPVTAGLAAITPELTRFIVGPTYRDATLVVLPLSAFAGLFRYLRGHSTDQVFLLNSVPLVSTLISLLDLCLVSAVTYVAATRFGLAGAAIAPLVSALITFVVSFVVAERFGFSPPLGSMLSVILIGGLMAVSVRLVPAGVGPADLIVRIVVGAAVYAALMALLFPSGRRAATASVQRVLRIAAERWS